MSAAAVAQAQNPAKVDLEFRVSPPNDDGSDTPDTAVVNSAFLRGLRESSYTNGLPSDAFFAVGRQAWNGIRRDFITTIAHPVGQPNEIAGFVTHAKYNERGETCKVVAWVYVAKAWRRFGVARALMSQIGIHHGERFVVMFASPEKLNLARAKGYRPAFLPFLSWRWLVPSGPSEPVRGLTKPQEQT
jgi:GNAT superfamily N-acetyltransferase